MEIDHFLGHHSSSSPMACAAFSDAVYAILAHRPAVDALQNALNHDPHFFAARAILGLGNVLLAREDTLFVAQQHLTIAQTLFSQRPRTACEIALFHALEQGVSGQFKAAANCLETHLAQHPGHALMFKLSHSLRFMSGEREKMRSVAKQTLYEWPEGAAGFGFVLGGYAFALGECGAFTDAETIGRQAVLHEPNDVWGHHAVGHVMEMQHRPVEGLAWLHQSQPLWPQCNNFARHLAWHVALFQLERDDIPAVLTTYDSHIDPQESEDFRDVANAVSLLWRMRQLGHDVGDRWDALYRLAQRRGHDLIYLFGTFHHLLTFLAVNDLPNALAVVQQLQRRATDLDDQGRLAAAGLADFAQWLLNREGDAVYLAQQLPNLGGSHAQRDVFLRTLIAESAAHGQIKATVTLLRMRREQRSIDRFHELMLTRLPNEVLS